MTTGLHLTVRSLLFHTTLAERQWQYVLFFAITMHQANTKETQIKIRPSVYSFLFTSIFSGPDATHM